MHIPIMTDEINELLLTNTSGIYVDATIGSGGHTKAMLSKLSSAAKVFGLDRDSRAIEHCSKIEDERLHLIQSNFASIDAALHVQNIDSVDGILADIGVSSEQIDDPNRGFAYMQDCILDMRMNPLDEKDAKYVLNNYTEEELADVIYKYGEERRSRKIAANIVNFRKNAVLSTTFQLKELIPRDSVRRVFQAIRIEVNNELENLEIFLKKSFNLLKPKGRIAIITFHSLEDRIVKRFFKEHFRLINKHVITSSDSELSNNSRSASAKLRVAEKE